VLVLDITPWRSIKTRHKCPDNGAGLRSYSRGCLRAGVVIARRKYSRGKLSAFFRRALFLANFHSVDVAKVAISSRDTIMNFCRKIAEGGTGTKERRK
jgi:hypothetical protein